MQEEIKLKVPEEDYRYETEKRIVKCLNCGADMEKFILGKASENVCSRCGFQQPCCE